MSVSQKCQYALRAVLELSQRRGNGPVSATEIAQAQAIPLRFLELILGELKKGGFVESRRGAKGGYILRHSPGVLTVGEVMRLVDGSNSPVKCIDLDGEIDCPLQDRCAFGGMWQRARDAVSEIYDNTTFADLIAEQRAERRAAAESYVPAYCI